MLTPLLYWTCMMVWSAITPPVNSCEYRVYYINNVSLTTQSECLPPHHISGK